MKKNVLTLLCCLWACTLFAQTWTGSVSTDWNTPGNWSGNAVPDVSGRVIIPGSLDNYPVLASDVTINRIDMQSGSMLDFNGFQLNIITTTVFNFSYFTGATLKSSTQLITLNINNGTSGYTTSMSGCTIEDDIVINLSGTNAFYEGDGAANVFQGNTTFNVGGSGPLWTSYTATSTYHGNVTVNRTVGGLLDLFNTGGNVAGNLSVTNPIGNGGIRIGTAAHPTIIQGTISIDANYNALPNVFEMTRVINFTSGGIIDVKNSYGFNLRNDTLRLSDLRIKGYRGTSFSYLYNNDIAASVDIADSSTSGSGYHTYLRNNVFTGSVLFERNGDIDLFEADANSTANVFNGPLQVTVNGTGDVYLSYITASIYNGNVTVQCNGSGIMNLFSAGGTINGNLIYNNNSTGNNLFGAAAARTLVTGTIQMNISNSNAGLFEMTRVINQTNGGSIFTSGTRGFNFSNDTLLLNQLSVQDVQGNAFGTIYNNLLTADISVADRNTTGNGYHFYMRNSNVNGNVTFTMNSQRYLYVGDNSNQPFTISGDVLITVNGTGPVYASRFSSVHVGGDVTVNRSGAGLVELYRTGATIGGNFSYTSNSQSEVSIGNTNSSTIISGTININANYPNSELFTVERVINQTAGGSIYINGSRGFTFNRDTLLADITLVEFRSTAFATLYDSEITGNTYISPSTNATSGYHTYVRSSVFNGEVRHFSTSFNNYYDSDAGSGNVYNGLVRYERTGSGVFSVGNIQNTYNGDLTMIDNSGVIARALFSASTGSSLSMNGNTINFLTLNTPQLVMNSDVRINNTLTFQSGLITLNPLSPDSKIIFNDNANHTGASASSHAVLTVQKEGNDIFTFPVGSGNLYAPVSMNAPATGSVFSVKYIPENPNDASLDTSSRAGTLQKITGFEYWEITRDAGTSTPTFTFAYNDPAPGMANYITDPASVRIARWNGTLWDNAGNTAFTGTTSGTITSAANISDFGFFTFGTTNPDTNPFMTQAFVYYLDSDGDGFGDVNNFITSGSPTPPAGYVTNSLDCDDTQFLYTDNDNDGYGSGAPTPCGVANNTDCNDGDNTIYPTAPELCDGKDNDCNGQIDDGVGTVWYQDSDGDGFGNVDVAQTACTQPTGYVSNSTDCNDSDNTIYPGATEVCDGVDNNCNGQVDEGVGTVWYQDSDGDGFGNIDVAQTACAQPTGYVSNSTDCNDSDNTVYPGAPELCDGKDNDCDGKVDETSGSVLSFDGINDFVSVESVQNFADFSISLSFKINDYPQPTKLYTLISKSSYFASGFTDFPVTITMNSDGFIFAILSEGDDYQNDAVLTSNQSVSTNEWHTATLVFSANNFASFYLDGTLQQTQAVDFQVSANSQVWTLGRYAQEIGGGINSTYFKGQMDEVSIWNSALSQAEVDLITCNSIDNTHPAYSSLLVYYTFNQGSGTVAINEKGLPNGIINGATWEVSDNQCFELTAQLSWYLDSDGDGFGDMNQMVIACSAPPGYVVNNTDCDDANNTVYPNAPELCDGLDNNCNGQVDEGVGTVWYQDSDGDGFGNVDVAQTACAQPTGYVSISTDCNDSDNTVYPGAPELCDGKDNDCDGQTDEDGGVTWYIDSDSDGFGDENTSVVSCSQPTGFVTNSLDCDDADDTIYPGAPELCDGKDNDCDGQTDEDGGVTWYIDSDSDGFGDANTSVVSCTQPTGYVTNSLDCDDADDTVYPGAPELCDGKDNDCDGQVDEGVIPTWYLDADSDEFGDVNTSLASCTQPAGYVTNSLDCDDLDNTVYPGAPELCDGKDNDCNGLVDDNAGTYNITASANAGGSISPNGNVSVSCGDDQTFLITADPGFVIFDVLVDGLSNGAISSYTFSDVSTTHTIVAFFSAIGTNDYTITASAGTGGSISPSGTTTVSQGSNITYTITADPCYAVADVLVNGSSIGAVTSYTFNNVNGNQTIDVSFAYMPAPGPFTGVVNVCPFEGTTQELTYSVPDMPGVLSYNWVVPPTVSLVSGQGTNSINITINNGFGASANKQLRVYAVWPCGNSALSIYYLLAQGPTTPQPIVASSDDVCNSIATATGITYTIPKVNAATAYNWTTPAGAVSVVHPNGAGENDTVVVITYGAAFTGGTVSVQAVNNCGVSSVRNLSVVRKQPSTPGLITGPVNVCEYVGPSGSLAMYTVGNDPTITEYVWSLPAGATDVSGQGTAQISFRYPVGFTGGSISVTAGNGCGVSTPRVLRVSTLSPGAPGAITVTNTQACPDRQFTYSLAAMPSGSTSVWWTVPAGATIVSGQGTLSILVAYPSNALAGTVTATGVNGCSSGNTRTIQVKLPECVVAGDVPEYVKQTTQKTELNAQIFPNPSYDVFNIIARTNSNEKIQVIITDVQGRKLLGSNLLPNQPNTVGAGLKPGVYFAEIIQGSQRIIRKILKQ